MVSLQNFKSYHHFSKNMPLFKRAKCSNSTDAWNIHIRWTIFAFCVLADNNEKSHALRLCILHIHRIESYLYAFRWKVYIENVKFRIWSVEKPTEKLCRYWWMKVMWKSKYHNYKLHIQKKIITDTVCVCYMSVCIHTNGKYVQLKDRSLVQNIIGRQSQKREKCRLQEAISIECNRVVHKRYERTLTEINRQCFGMPQASDRELIIEIILYVIIWCSEVISITIIWFKVCKNVCI